MTLLRKNTDSLLAGAGGSRKCEVAANGIGISFWGNDSVLKLIVLIVALPCAYAKTTELYILKE